MKDVPVKVFVCQTMPLKISKRSYLKENTLKRPLRALKIYKTRSLKGMFLLKEASKNKKSP